MASFNKVILIGNLTADPELKQTAQGTSVCSFSIGVSRRFARADQGQTTADFFNIVTWRQTAEFVVKYFKKGRPILVCGQLQNR
ncbi:MAG: single-stranded DNA-binding protein, partial [Clostridia bacterium]|nr:single-stranded DNA-binding protein [Clostridia bacterium]